MRYRLRTLMIVITAVCVFSGWSAYVRQMERFHLEEASKSVAAIVEAEEHLYVYQHDNPPPMADRRRREFAIARIDALISEGTRENDPLSIRRLDVPGTEDMVISNRKGAGTIGRGDVEHWRSAVHHRIIAERYRRHTFCPWLLLFNDSAP